MKNLFDYDQLTVMVMDKILFYLYNKNIFYKTGKESEVVMKKELIKFDNTITDNNFKEAVEYLGYNRFVSRPDDPNSENPDISLMPKGKIMIRQAFGILAYYLEFKQQKKLINRTSIYVLISAISALILLASTLYQIFKPFIYQIIFN